MKYIFLDGTTVAEIIPAENPDLPGFPIEKRYPADFIAKLIPIDDNVEVEQNWEYDPETKTFTDTSPEPGPEPYTVEGDEVDAAYREGVNSYE